VARSVEVHEAANHLSQLLDEVAAGEEVLILRRGQPAARLVAVRTASRRVFGMDRDRLTIPDDFDAPLPADS